MCLEQSEPGRGSREGSQGMGQLMQGLQLSGGLGCLCGSPGRLSRDGGGCSRVPSGC